MKKLLALLLVLAMALSLAACKKKEPDTGTTTTAPTNSEEVIDNKLVEYYMKKANEVVVTDTHVTFTDDSGRDKITVKKNPKNAAILYGSLACLWYEAGGTAQLAIGGKSNTTLYNEQIGRDIAEDEGVTVVSTSNAGSKWDVEAIIGHKPDLIVCSMGMTGYETIGASAVAANIPVIAIQYDHVQDYLKWFKVFCNLTGHPELWENVAKATAEKIIEVVSKVPADVKAPKVAIVGVVSGKLRIYGTEAAAGTILNELGGINVFDDGTKPFESIDIDLEQLYAKNPDIILINQRGEKGETEKQLNDIVGGNPVWEGMSAVKKGIIYLEKGLFHNKPNHRYQEAYIIIAQVLYPDTFGKLVTE